MWVSETKFRVSGFRVWGLVNLEVDVDDGHEVLLLHAEHQGILLLGRGTSMSAQAENISLFSRYVSRA